MIGNQPSLTGNIASKTISVIATAGQTLFTVRGGYNINQINVYRNGVRLASGRDYNALNGASVTLLSPAVVDDVIDFQIFDDFRAGDALNTNTGGDIFGDVTINGTLTADNFEQVNVSAGIITATNRFEAGSPGGIGVTLLPGASDISTFAGNIITQGYVTSKKTVGVENSDGSNCLSVYSTTQSTTTALVKGDGSAEFAGNVEIGPQSGIGITLYADGAIVTGAGATFAGVVKNGTYDDSSATGQGQFLSDFGGVYSQVSTDQSSTRPVFAGQFGTDTNVQILANGKAEFDGNVEIGPQSGIGITLQSDGDVSIAGVATVGRFDNTTATARGIKLFDVGQVQVQRPDTGSPSDVQAVFRGNQGTTINVELKSDGEAIFGDNPSVTNSNPGVRLNTFADGSKGWINTYQGGLRFFENDSLTSTPTAEIDASFGQANFIGIVTTGETIQISNPDTSISAAGQTIGTLEFKANDGSSDGSQVTGSLKSVAQAAFTGQGSPSHLDFSTNGVSGADALARRMRITYDGNVEVGPAAGIGVTLRANGSASFGDQIFVESNVRSNGFFQSKHTTGSNSCWSGELNGSATSSILAEGSARFENKIEVGPTAGIGITLNADGAILAGAGATFAGPVKVGPLDLTSTDGTGCEVSAAGLLYAQKGSGSTANALEIYQGTSPTVTISAAGGVTALPTSGAALKAYYGGTSSDDAILVSDTNDGSGIQIRLKYDGSATFTGNIVCDETGVSNSGLSTDNGVFSSNIAETTAVNLFRGVSGTNSALASYQKFTVDGEGNLSAYGDGTFGTALASGDGVTNKREGELQIRRDGATAQVIEIFRGGGTDGNRTIFFDNDGDGSMDGTLSQNVSDIKFKENVVDAPSQIADIKALQLRKWDWKADAPGTPERKARHTMGLVSQEAALVDSDISYTAGGGSNTFQAIDHDVLTMKLLGALQEALTKIETLETKVAALESS